MQKLIDGLHTFQKDVVGTQKQFFADFAKGQSPETLFITCSDSRINPNLLTQTQPGELFIVRNAGNIVPPHSQQAGGETATIEYGVAVLKVKHIVVCGHSYCGAVTAALNRSSVAKLPAVASWLSHAEATVRIIDENYAHLEGPARVNAAIQENVLVQLEHLRTLPAVASALRQGKVTLHGWVYKVESGEVFAYDVEKRQFLPVGDAHGLAAPPPEALAAI